VVPRRGGREGGEASSFGGPERTLFVLKGRKGNGSTISTKVHGGEGGILRKEASRPVFEYAAGREQRKKSLRDAHPASDLKGRARGRKKPRWFWGLEKRRGEEADLP